MLIKNQKNKIEINSFEKIQNELTKKYVTSTKVKSLMCIFLKIKKSLFINSQDNSNDHGKRVYSRKFRLCY